MSEDFDVVILGAGAAGLMCAISAGRRGRRVLVLDHAEAAGKKILISGGGRCNFTNLNCAPDRFLSKNPRFATSALARYTPADFLTMVEAHRIAWHEKTLGQLFCDGSARAIVAMLLAECGEVGALIRLSTSITDVTKPGRFRVATSGGDISADSVVLATGGLSIPKLGATGFSHDIAQKFGLAIVPPRPALVPLVLHAADLQRTSALSGVALPVAATCAGCGFREALLFTHRGLSGPAILQISSCWEEACEIALDLLPDWPGDVLRARKRERPKASVRSVLADLLPQRVAELLAPAELAGSVISEVADRALLALGAAIKDWRLIPSGSEGYAKAEVTRGGVATSGLSSRTMESKVSGLFVIGEAVDVTGWLGGYNFQWAWASGWCAGEVA